MCDVPPTDPFASRPTPDESREDRVELLRQKGLRVTVPRTAVLEVLARHSHLAADDIVTEVRALAGSVSVQAVYDVLHTLTGVGLLRSIEPAGSAVRYERRIGDNHHHLVCRACGTIRDVPCTVGAAPCLELREPEDAAGFALDEAEVTFWGLCADCQRSTARPHK